VVRAVTGLVTTHKNTVGEPKIFSGACKASASKPLIEGFPLEAEDFFRALAMYEYYKRMRNREVSAVDKKLDRSRSVKADKLAREPIFCVPE
jgi:hypothetical protein